MEAMQEDGNMVIWQVMVSSSFQEEQPSWVRSLMGSCMELEPKMASENDVEANRVDYYKHKAPGNMVCFMDKDHADYKMEVVMKVHGKMINLMVREQWNSPMEKNIQDNGWMENSYLGP